MHWLCKVLGHKHLKDEIGQSVFHPNKCWRCGELSPIQEKKGENVFLCIIFGHKFAINQIADFHSPRHIANFCWRCHDLKEKNPRYRET